MKDALAVLAVLLLIALFFLPAYFIGRLYFLLATLYMIALAISDKLKLGKAVERAISLAFLFVVLYLIGRKEGDPWNFVAVGILVVALDGLKGHISRREKNEGSSNPDEG
ncbi:hypothetical protein [Thermococcus thioreducens]|uniref:Uncharacterized protein n=1 Tax=Thermococcus thioreducens TaxID=277988 RepID=A0A0Q2M093_9EURY|nr:hypothetical protein [Thermococcus thioreducens]ASJ12980.1 hypothetical protein A3L14_08800 [Thermococcus thioreducens]KQH81473.1 hypothetical protein AMR53_11310 [Thermococcus thioreducens]SEV82673.1 hypothetical protein SAMN05216170_0179 [Thermococcus thioreducens]